MNGTTWHLTRARKGQPAHFCAGYVTQAEAEAAKADFDAQDAISGMDMVNTIYPPTAYREEPTPAGIQLCIPGTERRPVDNGKPAQLSLWG